MHQYSLITAGLSRWASPLGLGNYIDQLKDAEFWSADHGSRSIFTIVSVVLRDASSASRWRWR